jgi:hypothetical protein
MVHSRQKNGGNTCNKMRLGASSTSQKFVSPQKFHGTCLTVIEYLAIFHIFLQIAMRILFVSVICRS